MAQILNLSKLGSMEKVAETYPDNSYEEVEAGGYVCKICNAILVNEDDKKNIRLELDIEEGPHKGFFTRLEERANFWGLTGYMSFKESQIRKFIKTCTAFGVSNPGFTFDPFRKGGADVDTLIGKLIGVVIGREEYMSNKGEIREKCVVSNITEVEKIRDGKFNVPKLKKLENTNQGSLTDDFAEPPKGEAKEVPFS